MEPMYTKEYLECGGTMCPFCGSHDIAGKSLTVEAGSAFQPMYCVMCEEEWTDVYRLVSIHANGKTYDDTATDEERSYGRHVDSENAEVPVRPAPRSAE